MALIHTPIVISQLQSLLSLDLSSLCKSLNVAFFLLFGQKEGSKLRYLNGEVVDTTGKRYIEIKKDYPDMPKPVFLKAGRRYRFH